MTKFDYDPTFQTIIKYKDGVEESRLFVQQEEFESLAFLLWTYLMDKKFSLEVQEQPQSIV
jgi:hypothetical protein